MLPEQLDKMFLIRCDCTATVHLIYKWEMAPSNSKNSLIQHKFKTNIMFFLKIPSERLGPGASLYCRTKFSTVFH